jgi:RNA polymerase sigma factor (TIGR02999 family)
MIYSHELINAFYRSGVVMKPEEAPTGPGVDGPVTRVLGAISRGEAGMAEQLLPLVYDELRRLAAARLARELPGQTLDATALVHEAYLRLVGDESGRPWEGRRHFFAAAAEAMRRILVEAARRKRGNKHGGGHSRVAIDPDRLAAPELADDTLAIHEALDRLAATDAEAALLVKLRYFVGLSIAESATALGLSTRSTDRLWVYARAWLYRELRP